jgi:polysaccharide export outer membrane protein
MNILTKSRFLLLVYLITTLVLSACSSTKNVPYFQDMTDSTSNIKKAAMFTEPTIQRDDILIISIFTTDPATSMVVNQLAGHNGAVSTLGQAQAQSTNGILVDQEGNIDLPVVGRIKVSGLTTFQAKNLITQKAAIVYQDPTVQVRYGNFKVTILGEVLRPAAYVMPNERVSVLDALGLAGDLTIFGKRENVLVIRDNEGNKEYARLNLNSSQLFDSPYFFLRQNDVIYVEPNKGKAASLNQARTQTIAIIGSALSVLVVIFTRL